MKEFLGLVAPVPTGESTAGEGGRRLPLAVSVTTVIGVLIPGNGVPLFDCENNEFSLDGLDRPVRILPSPLLEDTSLPIVGLLESGWMLSLLRVSAGKSAMPIIIVVMVPIIAEAPPVTGSQGPSSVSYSRGRYLIMLTKYYARC